LATLQELHRRTEYLIDDTMPFDIFVDLLNECNEDISEVARYEQIKTAQFYKDDPTVVLPLDFIVLLELKMKRNSEDEYRQMFSAGVPSKDDLYGFPWGKEYQGFEMFGNSIEFRPVPDEDGSLLIRYYSEIPPFKPFSGYSNGETDPLFLSQRPSIQARFHRLYPLFAAMRYTQNWKDEQQAKNDFETEYQTIKLELAQDGERRRTQSRAKKIYQTRSWM
jgi:hypothetical protein